MDGIPVNGGRDLMFFNAIGGSYLLPNPNYGASVPLSTVAYVDPYTYSPPPVSIVAYSDPPSAGPAVSYTQGGSSLFATPTPLNTAIPTMARPEDEILTIYGIPGVSGPGGAAAAAVQVPASAMTRFPWWWLALGAVAVIVLSDGRDRR